MKIIISIILVVFVWINNFSQEYKWKEFTDPTIGYSVKYPSGWKVTSGKGGFYCGKKSGFENGEYSIFFSETSNAERMDMLFGKEELPEEGKVIKPITINGISGFHAILTPKIRPDEYSETIVLKTESIWFKIENNSVKDEHFKLFYESFKLLK